MGSFNPALVICFNNKKNTSYQQATHFLPKFSFCNYNEDVLLKDFAVFLSLLKIAVFWEAAAAFAPKSTRSGQGLEGAKSPEDVILLCSALKRSPASVIHPLLFLGKIFLFL